MKKASVVNLMVIIGILVLCVTTLIAIYATAPESTVLLLNENFDVLDESIWKHEVSECKQDSDQFHYVTADEENKLISDGVLHIYPNITDVYFRTKREARNKCYSCIYSENSTQDCISSFFSAKLQSKKAFDASHGRVEVRAKLCCRNLIKFNIGITSNQSNSDPEEDLESFIDSANTTTENSSEIRILFESASNKTIIRSDFTDSEFHTYVINWDEEKVTIAIDNKKVDEKKYEDFDVEEENISNGSVKLDSTPIRKPFYFNFGVRFEEKMLGNIRNHSYSKRSLDNVADQNITNAEESSFLEADYGPRSFQTV